MCKCLLFGTSCQEMLRLSAHTLQRIFAPAHICVLHARPNPPRCAPAPRPHAHARTQTYTSSSRDLTIPNTRICPTQQDGEAPHCAGTETPSGRGAHEQAPVLGARGHLAAACGLLGAARGHNGGYGRPSYGHGYVGVWVTFVCWTRTRVRA